MFYFVTFGIPVKWTPLGPKSLINWEVKFVAWSLTKCLLVEFHQTEYFVLICCRV